MASTANLARQISTVEQLKKSVQENEIKEKQREVIQKAKQADIQPERNSQKNNEENKVVSSVRGRGR